MPVLEAGPLAEREVYDPKAARQARLGDIDITQVGQGQKLPWEADGERWHTQDRVTTTGKPCKWDGAVLSHVVSEIQMAADVFGHELGGPDGCRNRRRDEVPRLVLPRPDRPRGLP